MAGQVPERIRTDHAAPAGADARGRLAHIRRSRVAPQHIEDKFGSEEQLRPFRNREDRGVGRLCALAGQSAAADPPGERIGEEQIREQRAKSLSPEDATTTARLDASRGGAWAWRDHAGALEIEIAGPPPFADGIAGSSGTRMSEACTRYRARGLERHPSPAVYQILDAAAAEFINSLMRHRAIPGAADEAGSDPVGRTEAEAARRTPALVDPLMGTTRDAFVRKKEEHGEAQSSWPAMTRNPARVRRALAFSDRRCETHGKGLKQRIGFGPALTQPGSRQLPSAGGEAVPPFPVSGMPEKSGKIALQSEHPVNRPRQAGAVQS